MQSKQEIPFDEFRKYLPIEKIKATHDPRSDLELVVRNCILYNGNTVEQVRELTKCDERMEDYSDKQIRSALGVAKRNMVTDYEKAHPAHYKQIVKAYLHG